MTAAPGVLMTPQGVRISDRRWAAVGDRRSAVGDQWAPVGAGTESTLMDTWDRIVSLRTELAAQAEAFTPAQWDTQSLCTGWRVRDVVAHMTMPERFSLVGGLPDMIRSGFRLSKVLHQDAVRRGSAPVADVLDGYRAAISHRTLPPGRSVANVLAEVVAHTQDIRRALGLPWSFDPEVLRAVADTLHADAALKVPGRVAGLRLAATDTGWAAGEGVEVSGPLEALVLAMVGRCVVLPELSGPGVATLAARTNG
ncbi:maleylpyruvate isomerase family mycothiol-dependent enzyme [Cellulomonas sp. KRMCY2]|uniref:maleylpyruvate isomerase family mycothiol-dependent enzyme n=1 Tax=Cellulomonas sp. KRMCY2 TaxID=1304865 RepID=UPI00045EB546|nr:maleylpyruvate isomerase family mycothiol-dependent enzyme [Cellulomonas sp. KRMCY2]